MSLAELPEVSDEIKIVPYVEVNGQYTISDYYVGQTWEKIVQDGSHRWLIYDGSVKCKEDFIRMMKLPTNIPCFPIWNNEIRGVAWLNSLNGDSAFCHHCMFKEMWGGQAQAIARRILDYWFNIDMDNMGLKSPKTGDPLINILLGVTPTNNKFAVNFVKKMGFNIVGEIPTICMDAYEGKRVSGTVSYKLRDQHGRRRKEQ